MLYRRLVFDILASGLMMTSSNGKIFRVTGHLCGNSPLPGEFPAQRPVTRSFDVFFDLRLNKRLSKHTWGWWFDTPSLSLWRHCNVFIRHTYVIYTMPWFPGQVKFIQIKSVTNTTDYGIYVLWTITAYKYKYIKSQIGTFLQSQNDLAIYLAFIKQPHTCEFA